MAAVLGDRRHGRVPVEWLKESAAVSRNPVRGLENQFEQVYNSESNTLRDLPAAGAADCNRCARPPHL